MGKMTGFLDYGREVSAETAARDRIKTGMSSIPP